MNAPEVRHPPAPAPETSSLSAQAGLTSAEAKDRLNRFGANEIAPHDRGAAIMLFLKRFTNPLIVILLAASGLSVIAGEAINASIIAVILLLGVILDFVQEQRSNRAVDRLRAAAALRATVIREGAPTVIAAREVVPGDLVLLGVGDLVPADACLLHAKDFLVDQAAFTGESFPVRKSPDAVNPSDRLVYLGTSVTNGEARAIITATGGGTRFGHIAHSLAAAPLETAFERGARSFGIFVTRVILALLLFVFFVNLAFDRDPMESFLFALALAVGLTPGLLPMIVSITLAHGARRLVRKKVLVKRLAAIEGLGGIDILCTDKTGTLTEGAIILERHVNLDNREDERVLFYAQLNAAHQTGLRSPLDDAILRREHGALSAYSKVDEIPFDFERRRLSVIVRGEGRTILITKGAPESIASICAAYDLNGEIAPFDDAARQRCEAAFHSLSRDGLRVLGIGYRETDAAVFSVAEEQGLIFLGFAAFLDPPKSSAPATLRALQRDAVEVKVLTGDNEIVTRKVCLEVGLEVRGAITGDELDHVSYEALPRVAMRTTIFARVSPDQKRRIIKALKRAGHSVGYLGDGINDAPGLHAADVGVSVDSAVDVAREAADLLLLQKSLHVLHDGILEGRRCFGNVMKYILMGTSSNFGNMFSMAGASLLLPFLPMTPPQILLNNLLYDLAQLPIPGDRVDMDYLRKPKQWSVALIRRYMLHMGLVSSAFDFLTFGVLIRVFHAAPEVFRAGWFIESLATQTLVLLVIRTRKAPWKSRPSRALTISSLAFAGLGSILPFTPLGPLLGFARPPLAMLATIGMLVLVYLIIAEAMKRRLYRGHLD
ncbi:MAG: magnesium-translocating P-type ATPase [Blastocatellia bacterium]